MPTRFAALLTLALATWLPSAQAQVVPSDPASAPAAAPTPAPPTPVVGPSQPSPALAAPADTLREYRLSETTRVRYENVKFEVTGGTPQQASAFQSQFEAALKAREGERVANYKQFVKVLPAEGTPGRYLWNSLSSEGGKTVSSRSLRTLGAGGGLAYQPDAPRPDTPQPPADASIAALLAQLQNELAHAHAELLANFDPASFGLPADPVAAQLQPGQAFTRVKVLRPPQPFATLPGLNNIGAPLQVEQQLRFENVQDGNLVFFRQARVLQPGQIVGGTGQMVLTLARYVYDGELRLAPDGLPASALRDEAYAVQVSGRVQQDDLTAQFSFTVTVLSALTLNPVQ